MTKKPAFGLVSLVALAFLICSAVIRLMLLTMVPAGSGRTLPLFLKAWATGLLFDLATLSYFLIPVAIYLLAAPRRFVTRPFHRWLVRFFFLVFIALMIFDGAAEYLFFAEFGTRFNFIAVDYIIYTNEVIGNIRESYPLPLIFGGIGAAALLVTVLLGKRLDRCGLATFADSHRRRNGALLLLPALAALLFVNISAATISSNGYFNELAVNGVYSLVAAFRHNELNFNRFYVTRDDSRVLSRLRTLVAEKNNRFVDPSSPRFTRHITTTGPEKRLNLIVVVEESLSGEFLGVNGNTEKITPRLDRLSKESLFFTNLYATGTRTVRGLEAVSLSIPPLPGTSIVKRPDNGGFRSWGEIMKEKGYDTRFIYAGHGYFDNMNAFFAGNGFSIVDRTDFTKDEIIFANVWGVCDEDLFRKAIKEGRASFDKGKPFFSVVMTTSNHRPYTYPEGRIDIPSKKGRPGGVKYADYSIGAFLDAARKEPWFDDTVFVFVADHCASSAGKMEIPIKKYEIPLLIYSPKHVAPRTVDRLMSQIDIAPTVLGLLNMSYDTDFIGRDMLKPSDQPDRAFISTYQKLGYLTNDRLLVLGPQKHASLYRVDRKLGTAQAIPMDQQLLDDMLAYYQGANHIYKNRLNRIR